MAERLAGIKTCRRCRGRKAAEKFPGASAICLTCIPIEDRSQQRGKRRRNWTARGLGPEEKARAEAEKIQRERERHEAAAEDERIAQLLRQHREEIAHG